MILPGVENKEICQERVLSLIKEIYGIYKEECQKGGIFLFRALETDEVGSLKNLIESIETSRNKLHTIVVLAKNFFKIDAEDLLIKPIYHFYDSKTKKYFSPFGHGGVKYEYMVKVLKETLSLY